MAFTMKLDVREKVLLEKLLKATGSKTKKAALIDAAKLIVNDLPGLINQLSMLKNNCSNCSLQHKAKQLEINFNK